MKKIFYSSDDRGFFDTSIHEHIPPRAVEITEAEYKALLDGQSAGGKIELDDEGKPYVQVVIPTSSVEAIKAALKSSVDAQAEIERLNYITPGDGQAMTYQQKVTEAQAFKAASNPKASDYPILSSEVGITAETLDGVADIVLAAFAQWQQIGAMIESVRLGAKRDIDTAEDEAAARAIVDAIVWPSAQVQA